jgi:Fe-S-cluster-containing dehydrogenase component/CRP-like cAMP-binding protein
MTLSADVTRFPEAVWDVPILRGLDARARAEIEAAGRVRRVRAGDVVRRAGEPADAIHVVTKGRVTLSAVRRGETASSIIRRVGPGEMFGEEATVVDSAVAQLEARCEEDGTIADVPVVVLRRALGRAGGGEIASRLERALRRAAALDLLRTASFTRALPERDVEILLDAARHVKVARGEHVYREGEAAADAFFVADGLLQAQTDDDGRIRVEAYLSRGDLIGDAELDDQSARPLSLVACGPAWLVAIPRDVFVVVARRNGKALERARRVRSEAAPPRLSGGAMTTAHVFKDLYRMRVARSLLVIDQDSCVRCGHCAWSCASVHDDGISRLVRHGERVVVQLRVEQAPLLVPNSCQHCKNPACMIDCPTGAIGRDARGEVFIREDLCTGCGSCAKACPWDNIAMAERADAKYPEVAVKCDLCSALPGGPACVAACPTEAILRVDPNEAFVELGGTGATPPRAPAWPWLVGAALASVGLAFALASASASRWTSGVVAGALVVGLVAYAGVRRAPRLAARAARGRLPKLARGAYVGHLGLGLLAVGASFAHAGTHLSALVLALLVALGSGMVGALAQTLLPRRLSRLERESVLPEDLPARGRELDERIFAQLTGKSEVVKTLYARVLRPYGRARLGWLWLVLSGRSLRAEEKTLRARIDGLLEGRKSDGLDDLIRLVAERRALRAQRVLHACLRGWVPLHVGASTASVVLLLAHVVSVMGRR